MTGIDRFYINAAVRALMSANHLFLEATIEELLLRNPNFGKRDTLGIDAIPEIGIREHIGIADPDILFLTEETGNQIEKEIYQEICLQPVVFISDPTDGSFYLKNLFMELSDTQKKCKFKQIRSQPDMIERWERDAGKPAIVSGATTSLSGVKKGIPFFSCAVNYITQDLLISCELGIKRLSIAEIPSSELRRLDLEAIFSKGENIYFNFTRESKESQYNQRFSAFVGKGEGSKAYQENLRSTAIFLSDPEQYLAKEAPVGPTRILYLSSLYKEDPMGFILANGEKITEWIHWLPYVAATRRESSHLRIFEISFERPWTKDEILMATSPAYSAFVNDEQGDCCRLNLMKIKDYPNPARYRSTILVTYAENEWALVTMKRQNYRELKFSFR